MIRPKRYLLITEKFPPRKGGSNTTFDEVYRRIGDKGTHIVTCAQPGDDLFDRDHPNTIHRLNLGRHWWLKPESLGIYGKLLLKSLGLSFRHTFDEVHAGRVLSEGLVGLIVARLFRKPLVLFAHGEEITTWRQPGKFKAMVFTYLRADRIISNSEFTYRELIKLGVSPEQIDIVLPGVDLSMFRPGLETEDLLASIGVSNGQKTILSVGRLSRRKGFDSVIRSLPGLAANGIDAHYAIVGIGEDHDYLKNIALELNVADRVHFLGHVSVEDLPRWYNAADLFAMPNREVNGDTEGFGKVYIEAGACGKPVLSGISGGTGSAVMDGFTGLRVDASKEETVFKGLKKLLSDDKFAKELGANGLERANKNFSWETISKQHQ